MNKRFRFMKDAGTDGGTDGGKGAAASAIDPAAFAALQDSVAKLEVKNKELLQEKSEAKKLADKATQEAARKSGDVEALEKSWQEKLAAETAGRDKQIGDLNGMVNRITVGAEASRLAAELALPGSADVLLPHISQRMVVEIKDGAPTVRVLDKNGKPSALTVADLKKEIEENAAFAPLLIGSKASGAGPAGGNGKTAAAQVVKREKFNAMTPAQQLDVSRAVRKGEAKLID